MMFW